MVDVGLVKVYRTESIESIEPGGILTGDVGGHRNPKVSGTSDQVRTGVELALGENTTSSHKQ